MKYITLFLLMALGTTQVSAQADIEQLKKHITYLASDDLEGRGTASEGERKAAEYLVKWFKKYKLSPKGDGGSFLQKFEFREPDPTNPHGFDTLSPKTVSHNVVAYLDNSAEHSVIIGAHYDHLGKGERAGSLSAEAKGKIHNGADDNASGTAGLLELARYYATNKAKEPYNFLFIAFSAEEMGLLGSKAFCERPGIDFKKVHLMINMDMIGRLDTANPRITVSGTGTSPQLQSLLIALQPKSFAVRPDSSGMGPSDHTSFYLKDIPVLHFFTGIHSDYHKPGDDAEKINYQGEKEVLDYMIIVTDSLLQLPKLAFTPTRNSTTGNAPRFKVTLGVIPDYAYQGEGIKLDGVTEGKPAQKAGIRKDDIVLEIGNFPTPNIMDYMKALSQFKKGDQVKVKLKRSEELMEISIEF